MEREKKLQQQMLKEKALGGDAYKTAMLAQAES